MPKHPLSHFDAYMRFLRLSAPLKSSKDALSVNEMALFEEIMLAWSQSTPLSVSQAIGIERLGAHATLFKRLAELRHRKLIETIKDESDIRTKYLVPTVQGIDYMCRFAKAMAKSESSPENKKAIQK